MTRLSVILALLTVVGGAAGRENHRSLWQLAHDNKDLLRVSTLFTAQQVNEYLSDDTGIDDAIRWCRNTGVTRVFIETFRSGYQARREVLENARERFSKAGFEVSGCVTTTMTGKRSTGWNLISCYTDKPTQQRLQEIFEYAASLFDEIMIDDFLFTDCTCDECVKARGDDNWADYRCELMVKVCRERILAAARAVNPDVSIIIKYPQWYDNFHNRGYDVVRQTAEFDTIWVGTETRDYDDKRWGGKVQYEAYYIMRWLGEIGGDKTGGGWFDYLGTTENTYIEQACQTVLADAREMMLFCYGGLLKGTGPADVRMLRREMPGLFRLARLVRNRPLKGIAAPKPPNSDAHKEQYVYDFVGMMGLPLVPTAVIDTNAKAAFYPVHSLKDARFEAKLSRMLIAGKPVLVTDGLAEKLKTVEIEGSNPAILKVAGNPRSLLKLTRRQLRPIRDRMLAPFGIRFDAPNKVALYLMGEDLLIIENFNDESVDVLLELSAPVKAQTELVIPRHGKVDMSVTGGALRFKTITPRTLVAVGYRTIIRQKSHIPRNSE